ncbi:MAG TPA: MFS transporter [Acidothermaceae bacterium]
MGDATSSTPQATAGTSKSLTALGLGGFVILGLPDGMWGTAWPAMRTTFHQPLSSLGLILLCATAGGLVTSLGTGASIRRFGVGRQLAAAGLLAAVGGTLLATAAVWAMVLVGAVLVGAAAGLLDTGLNTVIALAGRLRLLNMLHGAYGVGSALGPLVVTVAILATSWRSAYVLLIALELALAYGWWRTRSHWDPANADTDAEAEPVDVRSDDEPTRHVGALIALGVATFFFYTGLEVTAGQWAASFFRGPLHLTAGSTGPAVFVYWGSLTVARFAVAIPRRTPSPNLLIRIGCVGGLLASALIWWAPSIGVVLIAFAVLGATLAPVFPALVTLTPIRIGARRAQHAIGWQIAAATVGASGLSAIAGVILQHAGLLRLGPCLAAIALAMVACIVASELLSRR